MSIILGISAFYHDSAAAIIIDGEIIAAAQEERFTRIKHTSVFPAKSIAWCLDFAGLTIDSLDAIVFYDKPLLKFERLLETYYAFAPKGLISFMKAIPVWIDEKLFLKRNILNGLSEIEDFNKKKVKLLFSSHHLSHAASAFYPSPFREAAILTIDGVGEWTTASICHGTNNEIAVVKEMHFPHSVGLLYSSFTYFLGFTVNSGEYKLMGLAPYGNAHDEECNHFISQIKSNLVDVKSDGSIWLNQHYFRYATGLKMIDEKKWMHLFGFPRRKSDDALTQQHCNLAIAIQIVTEDIVLKMAQEAKRLTGCHNLCLAGGVALNCVANGKLSQKEIFKNIFIQPAAGDAGGALGAAMAADYLYFKNTRITDNVTDSMKGAFLGPEYSDMEVDLMCRKMKAVYVQESDFESLCQKTASFMASGNIIGWFQGRMEFGPRALGNRSILADARNPDMQKKLNLKIKNREGFRPFAPAVMAEDTGDYFTPANPSPYMLLIAFIKHHRRKSLPPEYSGGTIREKLYYQRSDIQSITHIDYSARLQTVHKETNKRFWQLINAFKTLTGTSLVVNTSFNVRGEPMVCSPLDAYRCFMNTDMDILVINNFIFKKTDQPDWQDKNKWKVNFNPD